MEAGEAGEVGQDVIARLDKENGHLEADFAIIQDLKMEEVSVLDQVLMQSNVLVILFL